MAAELTPQARTFLEQTTMKTLLGIPDEALDAIMAVGYQLYQSGRYAEVEILCRGLVAADHKDAWPYSLLAAALRRQGKLVDALAEIEQGLVYTPEDSKLLFMRSELGEVIERAQASAPPAIPAAFASPTNPIAG